MNNFEVASTAAQAASCEKYRFDVELKLA